MTFTAYGVFLVAAFVVAYLVALPRCKALGVPERRLIDLSLIAVLAGLVGARARYVWERPGEFAAGTSHERFWRMIDIDGGGLVWYGGALTATALMWLYVRWHRLPALAMADALLPAVLLGLAVGRIGCFANGCCYGAPTAMPWACAGPAGARVHPTQLYETIACALLAGGLWWWWRWRRVDGQIALAAVLGYAAWRFLNEGLRDHAPLVERHLFGLTLTTSQVTSLWLALAAVLVAAGVVWRRRRHPGLASAARLVPGSVHAPAATR